MKRLLIATDGFLPRWDGISSFINEMIPRIQDNFDITVIAPNLGELKQKYRAKIVRFNVIKVRLADNYYACFPNLFVMASRIRSSDLVWVQCLGPIGVFGIILSKMNHKKVLLYNHMIEWEVFPKSQGVEILKVPINIITKILSKYFYGLCDIIIVPSIEHAELLNVEGIKSAKKIVHLGVDINRYKTPTSKSAAKKNIGIAENKFVIGYAGRVSLEKDPKTLYRAFLRLQKKYKDIVLLIAGGGRPELEEMFSGKDSVILTGLKDDLSPYYQAMDAYVLPSLTETTSLTTMEAMASGLAVIATPVGFIKEYINDGENGLLFPKKNSYVLFQKLEYLYNHREDVARLGKTARATIINNYTWEKTSAGIKKVLDEA